MLRQINRQFLFDIGFLLTPLVLISLISCGPVIRGVTEEARPLFYVGSVQFGDPLLVGEHLHISVTMGEGPWRFNSGHVPSRITTQVENQQIDMTIHFSLTSGSAKDSEQGRRLKLSKDLKGEYEVFYRDPDGARHSVGRLNL